MGILRTQELTRGVIDKYPCFGRQLLAESFPCHRIQNHRTVYALTVLQPQLLCTKLYLTSNHTQTTTCDHEYHHESPYRT